MGAGLCIPRRLPGPKPVEISEKEIHAPKNFPGHHCSSDSGLVDGRQDDWQDALEVFFEVRDIPGLKKRPSTSELIDWLKLLMSDDIPDEVLRDRDQRKAIPPLYGALLKSEQDVQLLERLAFMHRSHG